MDVVLANTVDWTVVDKESNERVEIYGVHVLSSLGKVAELDLVLHVVDFLLSWVITHGAHQVRQLVQRYRAVESSSFGGVLILASDHGVVEEILHVLVGLPVAASFD